MPLFKVSREIINTANIGRFDPNWEGVHKRLVVNRRLNLRYIWEKYLISEQDGLGYSQFYRRYHARREETGKEVVMVQEREPGKEMFVDWMGDTLDCVVDGASGELLTARFYVAVLRGSGYPYVEAFSDEGQKSWLAAHVHALEWMGGVPQIIVPDNLKTGRTNQATRLLCAVKAVAAFEIC